MAAVAATWSVAVAGQVPSSSLLHLHPAIGYQPLAASPVIADAARVLDKAASYDQRRGYLQAVLDALGNVFLAFLQIRRVAKELLILPT